MSIRRRDFLGQGIHEVGTFHLDPVADRVDSGYVHGFQWTTGLAHRQAVGEHPVSPKYQSVRECDKSSMRYFTPRMYCQMNGYYIDSDDEIDEVSHKWDANTEEYNRDVVASLPDWVHEYMARFTWLHDAKVELVGKNVKNSTRQLLEEVTFRFTPCPSHGDEYRPMEVTFETMWADNRKVLPVGLATEEDECEFLYDEFSLEMLSASGAINLSYTFFCSDGKEYSFEGVHDIRWKEVPPVKVHEDSVSHKTVEEIVMQAVLSKMGPPTKKDTKIEEEKGRHGVRLFSFIFLDIQSGEWVVEQVKSKDWSTVWRDFQDYIENIQGVESEALVWEDDIVPYDVGTRNVFVGRFWYHENETEVMIVNTKRGRPIGADEYETLPPYRKIK